MLKIIIIGIILAMITSIVTFVVIDNANKKKKKKLPNYFGDMLSKTGHPIIRLYQNETPYLLLLDTGATHNIIDKRIILDLDKKFIRKDFMNISGINSNSDDVLEIYRIRFDDYSNSFTDDFIAMDLYGAFSDAEDELNEPIVGIIGVGFLSKYALTLDFKQNTVN